MEGLFQARSETTADDLRAAHLLARASRGTGVLEGLLGFLPGEAAGGDHASESEGRAVEGVCETSTFGDLAAGLNCPEDSGQGVPGATAAGGEDCLLGARWDGAGSGNGWRGEVASSVEFLSEPERERGRFADLVDGSVGAVLGGGAGGNDVAAVSTDVDLPGQGSARTGTDGGLPSAVTGGPIPHVKSTGRGSHPQRGGVVGGAALSS